MFLSFIRKFRRFLIDFFYQCVIFWLTVSHPVPFLKILVRIWKNYLRFSHLWLKNFSCSFSIFLTRIFRVKIDYFTEIFWYLSGNLSWKSRCVIDFQETRRKYEKIFFLHFQDSESLNQLRRFETSLRPTFVKPKD